MILTNWRVLYSTWVYHKASSNFLVSCCHLERCILTIAARYKRKREKVCE